VRVVFGIVCLCCRRRVAEPFADGGRLCSGSSSRHACCSSCDGDSAVGAIWIWFNTGRKVCKRDERVEVERGVGLLVDREGGVDVKEDEDNNDRDEEGMEECAVEGRQRGSQSDDVDDDNEDEDDDDEGLRYKDGELQGGVGDVAGLDGLFSSDDDDDEEEDEEEDDEPGGDDSKREEEDE
jgi:hypothetical protein